MKRKRQKFKFRFKQWQQGWSWKANPAAGVGLGMGSGDTFFASRELAKADALRVTATTLAYQRKIARRQRDQWLAEHPGRTAADYKRELDGEVLEWLRQRVEAADNAERDAWLCDHPGDPLPEHFCSMTDEQYAEYEKWREEREGV
jgi:hypothetical protein